MYGLVKAQHRVEIAAREAPTGVAALVIAEVFYKFHSFTLECLAFLATWFLLGWALDLALTLFRQRSRTGVR